MLCQKLLIVDLRRGVYLIPAVSLPLIVRKHKIKKDKARVALRD